MRSCVCFRLNLAFLNPDRIPITHRELNSLPVDHRVVCTLVTEYREARPGGEIPAGWLPKLRLPRKRRRIRTAKTLFFAHAASGQGAMTRVGRPGERQPGRPSGPASDRSQESGHFPGTWRWLLLKAHTSGLHQRPGPGYDRRTAQSVALAANCPHRAARCINLRHLGRGMRG